MFEPLPTPEELAAHVRNAYGVAATGATVVPGGLVHPAWRLTVPGGAWFAKWYRGTAWGRPQLVPVLMAQTTAADAGLPAPRPFADLAGHPLSPWRDGLLVCSEYLTGVTLPPQQINDALATAVGAALGRLHRALAALPAEQPWIPNAVVVATRCQDLLALAEGWRNPTAGDRLAVESLQYRLNALKATGIDARGYDGCSWQVCHGDYFPANLLFDGGQLTGIVDFDFAGPRWRTLELARAAVETAWLPDGGIAPGIYKAVLAGYQSTNPLSSAERAAGPRLWWEYLLHSVYPLPARYTDPDNLPRRWEDLLRRRHNLMAWLGNHQAGLVALGAL